jgi:hypothetical protein
MSELDYWTGFRDALDIIRRDPGKMTELLVGSRFKVETLRSEKHE